MNALSIFSNGWMTKLSTLLGLNTWKTYVPVVGGTVTAPTKATAPDQDLATYLVVGKTITIIYNYASFTSQVGSAIGSGQYFWSMPIGIKIDAAKVLGNPAINQASACGVAWGGNQLGPASGYAQVKDDSNFYIVLGRDNVTCSRVGDVFFKMDDLSVSHGFQVTLPIL